ncbi:terpenoid synthase [Aspergillus sclerotioniger CBS 115572]|uniref:Terpenoid synthase n=1 Tax=Aspergillus sclerotioniger CBS 115572 TaxID=1450535 RepID=A0A317WQA3_9EURO|nr:terpenoid synthase [Aspergillus sclerotioniger CBS 115572]PWY88674.1 terpenoid synthase [Aspergillus sclerotioniger CBS 115572]
MGIVASLIACFAQQNPRQHLLRQLRRCTFTIPDLQKVFEHWPQATSPDVGRLEKDVEARIEHFFPDGKIARKMRDAKVAEFGASWWPYASRDRLCIATYLSLWLFAWDDETDSTEISDLVHHEQRASTFREETKSFIHASLSDECELSHLASLPGASNPFIANFGTIGRAIAKSYTPEQRRLFQGELDYFLEMTHLEQLVQSSNELPTVEAYSRRRMGSGAVGVCLAITAYAYKMDIPPILMNAKEIQKLWDLTNVIICTTNDIMSLGKEIEHDQTDSLIPLLYAERGGPLQDAVDTAVHTVRESVAEFDRVADTFLIDKQDDPQLLNLSNFIDGCKFACTANLNWGENVQHDLPISQVLTQATEHPNILSDS